MIIPVAGFDPSLSAWGIAEASLDLNSGELSTPHLSIIETKSTETKQIRVNSDDLSRATLLAEGALKAARKAKVIFVEVPVGSQTARAMTSYGVCVGVLGVLRAEGHEIIEVTADEVKRYLSGIKNATKQQMIDAAVELYPNANFPRQGKRITKKAEHVADAIGAIHAGVNTPVFQNLMRILQKV